MENQGSKFGWIGTRLRLGVLPGTFEGHHKNAYRHFIPDVSLALSLCYHSKYLSTTITKYAAFDSFQCFAKFRRSKTLAFQIYSFQTEYNYPTKSSCNLRFLKSGIREVRNKIPVMICPCLICLVLSLSLRIQFDITHCEVFVL